MINLLPYETKRQTRDARINTILFRCVVVLGVSVGFLAIACFITYFFINNTALLIKPATVNTPAVTIQNEANTIKTNLANANLVLAQHNYFSRVIAQVAVAIPDGTNIKSLSLNEGSFGTTSNMQLLATTADKATLLKTDFEASKYFSNFELISTSVSQDPTAKYPYLINFSVTINRVSS